LNFSLLNYAQNDCGPKNLYRIDMGLFSSWSKDDQSVKLRVTVCGALPTNPLYAFMVWYLGPVNSFTFVIQDS
jgi:hypothetical protein